MKCYVLYNPLAANGACEANARALFEEIKDEKELCAITGIKDYRLFFDGLNAEDAVILCGGDGTLNRFINDTEGVAMKNDILYSALGTGNDFLKDLGKDAKAKPFSIKEYLKDLPTVEIDGKSYRFLNNVGFGIDGYCCEVGDALKKKSEKPVNYTAIAIKGLLFHYKPTGATVTVDGKSYRYEKVWLAPTMKGRFYGGGMMAAPEQDRNNKDGLLSLMLFYGKGKIKTLLAFPSIFKGEHVKRKNMVVIHTGQEIAVTFDEPRAVQIDGETVLGVRSYRAMAKTKVGAISEG